MEELWGARHDQVNLYAYVGNDPVNERDPSGLKRDGEAAAALVEYLAFLVRFRNADSADERYKLARDRATSQRVKGDHLDAIVTENEEIRSRPKSLRDPKGIKFSQVGISSEFTDGRGADSLYRGLKSGAIKPEEVDPIRVFRDKDGNLVSLDNRRLDAARRAGVNISTVEAHPDEVRTIFVRRRDGVFDTIKRRRKSK